MLTPYSIGLFFHFVGMVGLFVGYGLEWTGFSLLRRATTADQARSSLGLYRLSVPISGAGLLVLILSGGHLAAIGGGFKQGWLFAAFFGIFLLVALGLALLQPRLREIRATLSNGGAALSADTAAKAKNPMLATIARVRFLMAVGIVALMTIKPQPLGSGLLVLLGAIVLGVIASVGLWMKRSA
jgi:hypothetical protein